MSEEHDLPGGQKRPEIVDPRNVHTEFVDWIVTGGVYEGVLNVTLGVLDHSMKPTDDAPPRIVIASRLRMSAEFAVRLHAALGSVLGIPTDQPPPPHATPPKNSLN